jgi:hypothetical protein
MVLLEVELGLDLVGLEQSAHVAQAPGLLGHGAFTGLVDGAKRMAIDQAHQAHQCADGANAAVLRDRFSPRGAGSAEIGSALEPIIQVGLEASEAPTDTARIGEVARFLASVHLDLLQSLVLI